MRLVVPNSSKQKYKLIKKKQIKNTEIPFQNLTEVFPLFVFYSLENKKKVTW